MEQGIIVLKQVPSLGALGLLCMVPRPLRKELFSSKKKNPLILALDFIFRTLNWTDSFSITPQE